MQREGRSREVCVTGRLGKILVRDKGRKAHSIHRYNAVTVGQLLHYIHFKISIVHSAHLYRLAQTSVVCKFVFKS